MAFAIADYADLQARIVTRSGGSSDSNFADGVREAIHLAESEMNNGFAYGNRVVTGLRVPEMMVRSIETVDEPWESVPPGFLGLRAAWLVDNDDDTKETPIRRRCSPDRIVALGHYRGDPHTICLAGGQYRIEPRRPGETYKVRLLYYRRVPDLSDNMPCTVLLNRYPTIYLNGALANLEAWLTGDPRLQVWRQQFLAGIEGANQANRDRIGAGA